jgi:hypothetical protein
VENFKGRKLESCEFARRNDEIERNLTVEFIYALPIYGLLFK